MPPLKKPVAGAVPKTASTPKSSAKSAAVKAPTTKAVKSKPAASKSKASGAAAKTKAAAAPKAAVDPRRDAAALRIQRSVRGFLARRRVHKETTGKAELEAELEKLRAAAYLQEVAYNRKQAEKQRKKDMEARAKKAHELKVRKELLEACYDDEVADVERLLAEEVAHVDMADPHGNSLVSEAAAGGAIHALRLLLAAGADPNTQGEFKRTPLWRAAFLGQLQVLAPLLEAGADPRIPNEGGELPEHVASQAPIKEVLEAWDVSRTDVLMANFARLKEQREAAAAEEKRAAAMSASADVAAAKEVYDRTQQALRNAHLQLEKRIFEHDTCVGESKSEELIKVTLSMVKEAESKRDAAKAEAAEAATAYQDAKAVLREQQAEEGVRDEESVGIPIQLKDLNDVLIMDVGDKIRNSGKWPLVIDVSGQASVFLRYLDTNYVNACSSKNMEPNRLRRSLLGALRYGKPMVLDFLSVDLLDEVEKGFDAVKKGLFWSIMDKSLLENERYLELIRKDDGEEYHPNKFQDARVSKFKMFLLTGAREPNERLLERTYALQVQVK